MKDDVRMIANLKSLVVIFGVKNLARQISVFKPQIFL